MPFLFRSRKKPSSETPLENNNINKEQQETKILPSHYQIHRINENCCHVFNTKTGVKHVFNLKRSPIPSTTSSEPKLFSAKNNLASVVDLSTNMPPIYDQGELGSCVSNATCALLSYQYKKKNKNSSFPNFSRLYNYFFARQFAICEYQTPSLDDLYDSLYKDTGLNVKDGLYSVMYFGLSLENYWLYNISSFNQPPSPANVYENAKPYRNIIIKDLNFQPRLDTLRTSLSQGNPIIYGMDIYENFYQDKTSDTGVVSLPAGEFLGGHCMLIVGYDDKKRWFKVRNSWGNQWGDNGYCYIPYDYIMNNNYCSDFYTAWFG